MTAKGKLRDVILLKKTESHRIISRYQFTSEHLNAVAYNQDIAIETTEIAAGTQNLHWPTLEARFFSQFANNCLFNRLTNLYKSAGQTPLPFCRVNGSLYEKDFSISFGNCDDTGNRIPVDDSLAVFANKPVLALNSCIPQRATAKTAETRALHSIPLPPLRVSSRER